MSQPQDNAAPGFTSHWSPRFSARFGPWTLVGGQPLPPGAYQAVPKGRTLRIVDLRADTQLAWLQFFNTLVSIPLSVLTPAGVSVQPGMRVEFNPDGTYRLHNPLTTDFGLFAPAKGLTTLPGEIATAYGDLKARGDHG